MTGMTGKEWNPEKYRNCLNAAQRLTSKGIWTILGGTQKGTLQPEEAEALKDVLRERREWGGEEG